MVPPFSIVSTEPIYILSSRLFELGVVKYSGSVKWHDAVSSYTIKEAHLAEGLMEPLPLS